MADRASLKLIGFVFASLTAAVVLIAALLVHKMSAGELSFEQPTLSAAVSILTH
jgi:hypothetical protein